MGVRRAEYEESRRELRRYFNGGTELVVVRAQQYDPMGGGLDSHDSGTRLERLIGDDVFAHQRWKRKIRETLEQLEPSHCRVLENEFDDSRAIALELYPRLRRSRLSARIALLTPTGATYAALLALERGASDEELELVADEGEKMLDRSLAAYDVVRVERRARAHAAAAAALNIEIADINRRVRARLERRLRIHGIDPDDLEAIAELEALLRKRAT